MLINFAENVVVTPSRGSTQGNIKLGDTTAPLDELNIGPAFVNLLARHIEEGTSVKDLLLACVETFAGSENLAGAINAQITKWAEYGFIVFNGDE